MHVNDTVQFSTRPGDEFALRDGKTLFCKMDNDALDKLAQDVDSSIDFREGSNHAVVTTNTTNSSGSNNNSSEFSGESQGQEKVSKKLE